MRCKGYRMNGRITAERIELYIGPKDPHARYDEMAGRRFAYTLSEMTSTFGRQVSTAAIAAR